MLPQLSEDDLLEPLSAEVRKTLVDAYALELDRVSDERKSAADRAAQVEVGNVPSCSRHPTHDLSSKHSES